MEFAEYHPPLCHFLHPKRCSIWVSSQNLCTPAASHSSAWSGEAVSWEDGFATLLKSVNVQVSCLNMFDVFEVVLKKNLKIAELYAIPASGALNILK